ncbi:hypothetical protein [Brachybacterium sp. Marseille-Q7125]|uniref:hypothetical protein n=1 Tax=Brachybacterium sp. Marseille-Q7125 TaxID=2932815 RepID=UPI001FF2F142|nr:hypothetical protein [Brachybacterium sp. Marseille-Q7125]
MDAVTLRVGDLELMSSYYENALALAPLEGQGRPGGEVHRVLGRGQVPFVRLIATPGLPGVDPRQAGLFHTAFLFEDRAALTAGLSRAGLSFADTGRSVRVEDPWGTPVTLSLPGTGTEELLAR